MTLSANQLRFLAMRCYESDDVAAARRADIDPKTVDRWKSKNPEFREAYDRAFAELLANARAYSERLVAKAAYRLDDMLDATRTTREGDVVPDWDAIAKAIDTVYIVNGLKKTRTEVDVSERITIVNDVMARPLAPPAVGLLPPGAPPVIDLTASSQPQARVKKPDADPEVK